MKFINNLFIVIMIITGSVVVYKAEAKEVWVITSLNWQPYSGAEIMNQGNSIQKLRSILKKEKIELLVEFHPWKRSQAKAKSKEYIGYFEPYFDIEIMEPCYNSVEPRSGREVWIKMIKKG